MTVVLAEKSNEKRFANASVYNSKNQKEWQKILAHGRKMIKTIWHIRIGALLFAVFCVGISNLIPSFSWVFFNAIAWWLVGIMFVSTSVKKTKEVIALLEKRYT